jgi:hypothetical protein
VLCILCNFPVPLHAQEQPLRWPIADQPAYLTSPYHGVLDGNGQIIPCRCLYRGQDFKVGDVVCMAMPSGTVMTRCDLVLNNTSWIATTEHCVLSQSRPAFTVARH